MELNENLYLELNALFNFCIDKNKNNIVKVGIYTNNEDISKMEENIIYYLWTYKKIYNQDVNIFYATNKNNNKFIELKNGSVIYFINTDYIYRKRYNYLLINKNTDKDIIDTILKPCIIPVYDLDNKKHKKLDMNDVVRYY